MNRQPSGEQQDLQELIVRAMPAMPGETAALFELQKKRREEEELKALYEERKQVLESLDQRIEELQKEYKNAQELHFDLFLKDADQAAEKAERELQDLLQKEEELEQLKKKYSQLLKRQQELELQVQRHSVYWDFMEQVLKMSKFEDVDSLARHLESLLHFRDSLYKRYNEAQQQVDQLRRTHATLEDQHHFTQLQKNNKLLQLQTELQETLYEALIWERRYDQIQETASKRNLLMGQIKMATLNLYEMAGGKFEGEDRVSTNDTGKQLERIKLFIQDYEDILKTCQSTSQKDSDKQIKARVRKPIGTHCKKH